MRRHVSCLATTFFLVLTSACGSNESPSYPVTFQATDDGVRPLAGVRVLIGKRLLGKTNTKGSLQVGLRGREGELVRIKAECPIDYRSPEHLPKLTLRRVLNLDPGSAARGVQVSIECRPKRRQAALVVRTKGRSGIPILVDGVKRGETEDNGVAHLVMSLPPYTTFKAKLDTSAFPLLRPQMPEMTFTLSDGDDVFVLDQTFSEDKPVVKTRRAPKARTPKTNRPVRIQ